METRKVRIGGFDVANDKPLTLIAGPCQMESREHALRTAEEICRIASALKINVIYKSSFDKANRTSISSERGIGLKKALPIFAEIKEKFGCPVMTDVHSESQCEAVADVVDVLQIPAFLCRQTDLLLAAGMKGRAINVKKGQFLAPWDMENVAKKIASTGNNNIMLCERGASFGYNRLVSDMRSIPIMAKTGYPIVFDATHSVQEPGGEGGRSGGQREYVAVLARAAVSVGIAALFLETHPDPENAPSDGPCMVRLQHLEPLLAELLQFDALAKKYSSNRYD